MSLVTHLNSGTQKPKTTRDAGNPRRKYSLGGLLNALAAFGRYFFGPHV